jgi:hypothetical protein
VLRDVERAAWQAALLRDASLRLDPVRRRAQGVVHTPPELARGVVRVLDELLVERFGLRAGVCDERVHAIDPACGPGAFLAALLAQAEQRGAGARVRMTGYDLDPAALERARALTLHPAGAELVLEQADMLDGGPLLALAAQTDRVLAVVGNPPWSIARARSGQAAQQLLEDFRCDADGVRLEERKLGVLSDAYVRFFRVCAEAARLARAGALIGLVSNASFLDGPVHRGMRAALLRWFDAVFVLDLGGSALLGRAAGPRDENVFGVRPGVAITWLCRLPDGGPAAGLRVHAARSGDKAFVARVHYARMGGDKLQKLARLASEPRADWGFRELTPAGPWLRFVPTRVARASYRTYASLAECLPFQREGVQSNRDAVVIDADPARLAARLRAFVAGESRGFPELARALQRLPHYEPRVARARIAEALERDPAAGFLQRIAYRPFDERFVCALAPLCHRPRPELALACAASALVLVSVRKDRGSLPWNHFAASPLIVDNCFLSARSSCRARAFPSHQPDGTDNLASSVRDEISQQIGVGVDALAFQHYALCWLSAASYRDRFDEELRQDYPRIPLPRTAAVFRELSCLGAQLARLFAGPIDAQPGEPSVPDGVRHRDLVLDAADGCVRLQGSALLSPGRAALTLRIGHHQPLAAYLAARSERLVDAGALAELRARVERLRELSYLLEEIDAAVSSRLGELPDG